jgi:hypothetical protein
MPQCPMELRHSSQYSWPISSRAAIGNVVPHQRHLLNESTTGRRSRRAQSRCVVDGDAMRVYCKAGEKSRCRYRASRGTDSGQSRSETSIPSDAFQPVSLREHTKPHFYIDSWRWCVTEIPLGMAVGNDFGSLPCGSLARASAEKSPAQIKREREHLEHFSSFHQPDLAASLAIESFANVFSLRGLCFAAALLPGSVPASTFAGFPLLRQQR